jgi:hypothetical protein
MNTDETFVVTDPVLGRISGEIVNGHLQRLETNQGGDGINTQYDAAGMFVSCVQFKNYSTAQVWQRHAETGAVEHDWHLTRADVAFWLVPAAVLALGCRLSFAWGKRVGQRGQQS